MAKVGRPEIAVDPKVIQRLAQVGCSVTDIAHVVGLSRTRIYERFGTLLDKSDAQGKVALRLKQHELAMAGNVTMLVWLGKNRLGQSDKHELGGMADKPIRVEITEEELERRATAMADMWERARERVNRADGDREIPTPPSRVNWTAALDEQLVGRRSRRRNGGR